MRNIAHYPTPPPLPYAPPVKAVATAGAAGVTDVSASPDDSSAPAFADFLSDLPGDAESDAGDADSENATTARQKAARTASPSLSPTNPIANPPPAADPQSAAPLLAASVQQALLTAPATALPAATNEAANDTLFAVGADSAAAEGATSPQNGAVGSAPIAPHGPPPVPVAPSQDPIERPPLIEPHGPPTAGSPEGDSSSSSKLIAPHAPPPVPVAPDQDPIERPPLIQPHGPPTAGLPEGDPSSSSKLIAPHAPPTGGATIALAPAAAALAMSVSADPATNAPASGPVSPTPPAAGPNDGTVALLNSDLPNGGYTTTLLAAAASGPNVGTAATVTGGLPKGEYTTTIPAGPALNPAAPATAEAKTAVPEVATPVSITTAAQLPAALLPTGSLVDAGAANIAALVAAGSPTMAATTAALSSQVPEGQTLTNSDIRFGTATAKGSSVVTTQMPAGTPTLDHDTLLKRGAAVTAASAGTGGSTGSGSKDASAGNATTLAALPVNAASTNFQSTPAAAVATPAAAPATVAIDKIETLLQTVLDAGTKLTPNSSSQMELHVRLNGGTDDVTVRMQMSSDRQVQVTFQTASPELRQALERGWSDLNGNIVHVNGPAQPALAEAAPAPSNAPASTDPSAGQQNPRQQSSPDRGADQSPTSSNAPWRAGRPVTTPAPSASSPGRSDRWSGWA